MLQGDPGSWELGGPETSHVGTNGDPPPIFRPVIQTILIIILIWEPCAGQLSGKNDAEDDVPEGQHWELPLDAHAPGPCGREMRTLEQSPGVKKQSPGEKKQSPEQRNANPRAERFDKNREPSNRG